jgi:hypothetical protein
MKRITVALAIIASLTLAAPALAVTSNGDGYGGVAGVLDSGGTPDTPSNAAVDSGGAGDTAPSGQPSAGQPAGQPSDDVVSSSAGGSGSLPFTGQDAVLAALAGVALIGVGLTARRYSRQLT